MESNKKIMNLNENGIIIPKHEFERVDFNTPATIISYGDEVREKIGAVLKSTAEMHDNEEEIVLDEKEIRKALDLDASLDESDKNSNKKELAVVSNFKKMLTKVGVKKFEEEEENNSYKTRYLDYCKKIEEVTEAIRSQRASTVKDFELKRTIVEQLLPHIEELDEIIEVGKVDLQRYEQEVNELKQKHEVEGGADLYREIQVKSMLLEAFRSKMDELERENTLYKEQIQAYRLQQGTDIITITSQDSYIKAMAPTLTAQGSISIFNRIQNRRLKQIQGLNDLTNEMITNNAIELQENAQRGANLYINKGISTETLTQLHESLKEGFKIYTDARVQKTKKIEKDKLILGKIQESLREFQNSIAGLVDDTSVYEELRKDSSDGPKLGRKPRY